MIKVKLQKWENEKVVMQILEQDKEAVIRLKNGGNALFKHKDTQIVTVSCPGFITDERLLNVFIRGDNPKYDFDVSTMYRPEYEQILEAFKEWGKELAKNKIKEPTDLELYKWAYEYSDCEDRDCDDCAFHFDSDGCCKYDLSEKHLIKAYKKANKTDTTFTWIDKDQGIFEL